MESNSDPKKLVFSQKAKDSLPGYLKVLMHRFRVEKVWTLEGYPPLPTPDMTGIHYTPQDQPEYVAYCQRMLDQGKVTPGIAKSFLVGLRGCGKAGEELSETLKKKILKR